MAETEGLDRKLFASGVTAARKLNGHADEHVEVIKKCGEQLAHLCPISLHEYSNLPRADRRAIRRAVQSALELQHLPDDHAAYGKFLNLLGQVKNPLQAQVHRGQVGRLLHYFASRG